MSIRALDVAELLPVGLARELGDAGLRWRPTVGDRFVLTDRDMDADVFVVSDMVADVHDLPGGTVIGFNGTVEWALDSVESEHAVWLPAEDQLRRLLGGTFLRLVRDEDGWTVVTRLPGQPDELVSRSSAAVAAYAGALLALLGAAAAD